MKLSLILVFLVCALFGNATIASEGHGDEGAPPNVGKGKAVVAFTKEDGFQLSDRALKNLGISFSPLGREKVWAVPSASLVRIKQSTGVYRRYERWILLVLVKVISRQGSTAVISSADLEGGDEIAVTGAPFLRMIDADLNAGSVDSCAH